ncbi:Ig-like domain-containing protein [Aquabacterium sp.]|uniref:Ig-like domain-containing protein n=1 Tax=Aquabacterium sp. TaxID=1872578 RepID=UPI0037850517
MRRTDRLGLVVAVLSGVLASCGGGGESPPATITATADAATLTWNSPATLDVVANDMVSRGTAEVAAITSSPAHGTAAIASGKVIYTPAAGYFGEDRFSYAARASAGGALSSAEVKLTISASLKIEGRVAPQTMSGASLSITIGDRSAQAVADAKGAYTVTLTSSDPAEMVTLVATGAGNKNKVKLTSLAGNIAGLAQQADARGVLAADRVPPFNVSPLTSAVAALIVEANGGRGPADGATLRSLLVGLPPQRIMDLAAVVSLVADETVELPEDTADTQSLIAQPASESYKALVAYQFYSTGYRQAQFAQARSDVTSSAAPSGTPAFAASGPVDRAYVMAFRATSSVQSVFVNYRPDGTATLTGAYGSRAGTWKTVDGSIRIALEQSLSVPWSDFDPITEQLVSYRNEVTGYTIRQFAGDSQHGAAVVAQTGTTHVLDGPSAGSTQPIADSGMVLSVIDPSQSTPLSAADFAVGSRWTGIPLDSALESPPQMVDTLEILDGKAAKYIRTGTPIQWTVKDGWLQLIQGSSDRRYLRLLRNQVSGEERWLVADFADGKVLRANEIMVISPKAQKFVAQGDLFRRWQPGTEDLGVTWPVYFLDLMADGKARQGYTYAYADEARNDAKWNIDTDGQFNMTIYQRNGSVLNSRTWSLVGRTATQFFVLEHTTVNAQEFWRLNVYTDSGPVPQ